jgi:hypothetical protein
MSQFQHLVHQQIGVMMKQNRTPSDCHTFINSDPGFGDSSLDTISSMEEGFPYNGSQVK